MIEVAQFLINTLGQLLTWMKDNPFGGILTFVMVAPVLKLLANFLRRVIHR